LLAGGMRTAAYFMQRTVFTLLIYVLAATLSSCSNQQLYDAIQVNRRNACLERMPRDYETCRSRYGMNYDDYQEARAKVLEDWNGQIKSETRNDLKGQSR
jgi:hypothetical protein